MTQVTPEQIFLLISILCALAAAGCLAVKFLISDGTTTGIRRSRKLQLLAALLFIGAAGSTLAGDPGGIGPGIGGFWFITAMFCLVVVPTSAKVRRAEARRLAAERQAELDRTAEEPDALAE